MSAEVDRPDIGCAEVTLLFVVLLPLHVAFSSFVGWKLWNWFAVAAWGQPALSYGQAVVGAALVTWVLPIPPSREVKARDLYARFYSVIVWHAILLAIGAVGHRMGAVS